MYLAIHSPMFGTVHIDAQAIECPTCPRGTSLGASDWRDVDIATLSDGSSLTCNRCGSTVMINWPIEEPDHLSTWLNSEYCPHRLCKIKLEQLKAEKAWAA